MHRGVSVNPYLLTFCPAAFGPRCPRGGGGSVGVGRSPGALRQGRCSTASHRRRLPEARSVGDRAAAPRGHPPTHPPAPRRCGACAFKRKRVCLLSPPRAPRRQRQGRSHWLPPPQLLPARGGRGGGPDACVCLCVCARPGRGGTSDWSRKNGLRLALANRRGVAMCQRAAIGGRRCRSGPVGYK